MMSDGGVKLILAKPIQLADQVTKLCDESVANRQECMELKPKTERLASLLRQAARADLYERPAKRIMIDTEQVLDKALQSVYKCRSGSVVKRMFTMNQETALKKSILQVDNSIGDVSWLIRVSTATTTGDDDDDQHLGLPPIAQNEPILFLIWEQIATLQTGSLDTRGDAAASIVSLARDNDRYGKLIIEEDGVVPLLRLVKEGRTEGQENAVRAIGLLARDSESVDTMMQAGVCAVFAKVLKDGCMQVQSMVAWAVSELAICNEKCQDMFAQNNVIRLLVGHLAFETVQEHSKYAITNKTKMSIHSVVMDNKNSTNPFLHNNGGLIMGDGYGQNLVKQPSSTAHGKQEVMVSNNSINNQMHDVIKGTMNVKSGKVSGLHGSLSSAGIKSRELEDPETKATMKAMAAKALWHLAMGNKEICKSITESKALLCFAVLLEKQTGDVQYNSAMALMEICRVAEKETELRRSAFKPSSPAAKAVVEQLLRVVEKSEYDELLIPCIISLGCISRTFRATETRIIGPLVKLLDEREPEVTREAVVALTKFAETDNYLHGDHSKAIINAGGAKHLVQLVYFGEHAVQKVESLILVCYLALHVPDSEDLAQAEILTVLEWAAKQSFMIQHPVVETLLPEAKVRLELYQSRGAKNYH